ncbi:MAG: DEAD/DEAH box helicase family protein, partial [Candidatus Aegiribacteria sp.]
WQIKVAKWISKYYKAPLQKSIQLFMPPKFYKNIEHKDYKQRKLQKKFILTKEQKVALDIIIQSDNKFALIHGITGSGKTEIYLHLVEKYMNTNKQTMLIVPEISLTPQMVEYFQRIFGNKVAILHSRLTEKEKSLEWLRIYFENTPIIIGPRSAIFAPVKNLGLIILDEEHEFSYKQEQNPRYNTFSVTALVICSDIS